MKNYKKNSILIFLLTIFLPTASQAFTSNPALAKQKVLLQQYQEQIKLREAIRNNNGQNKDDSFFEITTNNGKIINLQNCEESCAGKPSTQYILQDVVNDKFAIFSRAQNDATNYSIINLKSGATLNESNYPNFSPNYKKITIANSSEIKLYEISSNNFILLFNQKTAELNSFRPLNLNHIPAFHSWKNDNEVKICGLSEEQFNSINESSDKEISCKLSIKKFLPFKNMILSYNRELKAWEYRETEEKFLAGEL